MTRSRGGLRGRMKRELDADIIGSHPLLEQAVSRDSLLASVLVAIAAARYPGIVRDSAAARSRGIAIALEDFL